MGLFSRTPKEPIVHPRVERAIHVRATRAALGPHLDGYADVMGRRARELDVALSANGDWLRLDLPVDGVHPWELHNLAYWLLELGEVIAVSGPSSEWHGYHLTRADDPNDLLEGWTDAGEPLTVYVPGNEVIRPDAEVPTPARTTRDALRAAGVPDQGWTDLGSIVVRTDDPGRELNPSMTTTRRSRKDLRSFYVDLW